MRESALQSGFRCLCTHRLATKFVQQDSTKIKTRQSYIQRRNKTGCKPTFVAHFDKNSSESGVNDKQRKVAVNLASAVVVQKVVHRINHYPADKQAIY